MTVDKNLPSPLYMQLKNLLEEEIVSGRLQPNQLLPSERELCRRYQVSQITVRQAFKELETIGLVLRVPGRGTFVAERPEPAPKSVRVVGLVAADILSRRENSYMVQLLAGVRAEVRLHGAGFMLFMESETTYCDLARHGALHGLVVTNPNMSCMLTQQLERFGVPVVVLGRPASRSCFSVDSDNPGIGYQLTRHLLDAGYRNIGFIGFEPDLPVVMDRLSGYKSAQHEAGITVKRNWLQFAPYSEDLGYREIDALLQAGTDAVFCADDQIAMNVLHRLHEKGIEVPTHFGLTGCNNSILARYARPALTSMELFPEQLGILAIRKLWALMNKETPERRTLLKGELQIRASSHRKG